MTALYPEQQLRRLVQRWALRIRVEPARVDIVDMRESWGSCCPDGVVRLSTDLLDADEQFQELVVVHELLHLRIPGHGKRFQASMSALIPEWREVASRGGLLGNVGHSH